MLNLAAARFLSGVRGANLDVLARAPFWDCLLYTSIRLLKHLLQNPELLELPANQEVEY